MAFRPASRSLSLVARHKTTSSIRAAAPRCPRPQLWQRPARTTRSAFLPRQLRCHSSAPAYSKVYQFDEVKDLSENKSPDRVLIDVREPAEFEAGAIPSSINIPISSQPDALMLQPEEFEDRFGFEKPETNKEVVFYCKAGVRSSAAARLASQSGYQKVGEYRGSWLDWNKNGGKVQHNN